MRPTKPVRHKMHSLLINNYQYLIFDVEIKTAGAKNDCCIVAISTNKKNQLVVFILLCKLINK